MRDPVPLPLPFDEDDQELEEEPAASLEVTRVEPPLRFEENVPSAIEAPAPDELALERTRLAREKKALAAERTRLTQDRAAFEKKIVAFRAAAGAREAALARKEKEVVVASRLFAAAAPRRASEPRPAEPMRRLVARRRVRRI